MGCTLYRGRLHASPYTDLLSPALWDEFALEFARQCCSLIGQVLAMAGCPAVGGRVLLHVFCFLGMGVAFVFTSNTVCSKHSGVTSLIAQSCHSPLLVSVAAGAVALPTLLKMATLITGKVGCCCCFQSCQHALQASLCQGMGTDADELPVELELGREFVFHSIFACPVSREQSSSDNPPTMLPCGHVLCRLSIMRLAKHSARTFKCPYCPAEASVASCKQLYFPDME